MHLYACFAYWLGQLESLQVPFYSNSEHWHYSILDATVLAVNFSLLVSLSSYVFSRATQNVLDIGTDWLTDEFVLLNCCSHSVAEGIVQDSYMGQSQRHQVSLARIDLPHS